MSDDFLTVAVPGDAATVAQLKSRLEEIGVGGWIIDGACVAYPEWVLARLALNDELDTDELGAQLAVTWPDVRLDEVEISSGAIVGPAGPPPSEPLHEVGIARTKGLGLEFEADWEKVRLAEARSGERSVFARVQPFEGPDHELLEMFTTAKRGSVLLWRRGPRAVLHVLRRGDPIVIHVWEPSWTPVGDKDSDELREGSLPAKADASKIAEVLELLPESVAPLRELMCRENPPLDELCELLDLPPDALRVISGECTVEELPGAEVHKGGRAFGWQDLLLNVLSFIVFGSGIVRWLNGGSAFWGLLGVAGLALTIKIIIGGWTARRRRVRPGTD